MERYDAVVVGAGPAGGVAAWRLAASGCRVLLLEKETLPRYKACGGGVVRRAWEALPFDLPAASSLVEARVTSFQLSLNQTRSLTLEREPAPVLMTMRSALDEHIAGQATRKGAALLEQAVLREVAESPSGVRCTTSQGVFVTDFLIGADGANSIVARQVRGLQPPRCGVALEAELYPKSGRLLSDYQVRADFDFNVLPGGYGWVFPKADHLSVGVYTTHAKMPALRDYLDLYLQRKGLAREAARLSVHGHRIPLGPAGRRLNTARILLAGDAAGLADPLTGEGISYAIRSGRLAAEAVLETLGGGTSLDIYSARIRSSHAGDIRVAVVLARVFYRFPSACFGALARRPQRAQQVVDVFEGRESFGGLLGQTLRHPHKLFWGAVD